MYSFSSSSSLFPLKFFPLSLKTSSLSRTQQIKIISKSSINKCLYVASNKITTLTKCPSQLIALIFKSMDEFVCEVLDLPLRPTNDPQCILSGNFAPTGELPPTPCEAVEGILPSMLDGVYIRNGSNPQFMPRGPYHSFDGDGMLHAIRVSGGHATLCSRYVMTHKLVMEKEVGYPFIPNMLSSYNGIFASIARCVLFKAKELAGYLNPKWTGFGTVNTNIVLFGGTLFALSESDLPYAIKVTSSGDIVTLSRHDFNTDDRLMRMCAHPKIDPDTGEIFSNTCDISSPFLTFFKIDPSGTKIFHSVPIFSITKPLFLHDFGLTKRFIIFQDIQLQVDPMEIVKGRCPVVFNANKIPRIGILPRHAKHDTELTWIDIPGFNMMHVINTWEEEDSSKTKITLLAPNFVSIEHGLELLHLFYNILEKVTIDIQKRQVVRQPLCPENLEFGTINPYYAKKKVRYVYAAMIDETPRATGIVKLDLEKLNESSNNCIVARHLYGDGCFGGEPFFVPRERELDDRTPGEDDGFLVTYLHDENEGQSWFLVVDALNLDMVARIKLPGRVPYGFHGLFVKESDLNIM